MKTFSELTEDKGGKNLHLEHLEDEILNYGVEGGRAALNFLRSLRDMLSGASRSSVNMTVKWDGAPAIFAGVEPETGDFFVAKKSVFNVSPKLYKTSKEIDDDLSGALNSKFKVALKEFSKLGIEGVLQGDLMWTDDVETETIDGTSYYTFQPNTIVYAVPTNSDFGRKIRTSKIGIVWHTTYSGTTLQGMKASFGADISKLSKPSSVWMDDATYKDTSGKSTFTAAETEKITNTLSSVGKTFQKINANKLRSFLVLQGQMTGTLAGASLKTYNNSKVRAGEKISNHIIYKKSFCVKDFMKDYNSYKGNAYGLANTLFQTSIFKPKIKSKKIKGLYFTGQLTVPGPGVPPSLISGKIVSSIVVKDFPNR